MMMGEGRKHVVIEGVAPAIDAGRFPIKRTLGERVVVEADIFTDGHNAISGLLCFRAESVTEWTEIPLTPLVNDRWRASFIVTTIGRYVYTLEAWVDHFKSWRRDLAKKVEAGQDVASDLLSGAELLEAASGRATGEEALRLQTGAQSLRSDDGPVSDARIARALDDDLAALMARYPDRSFATRYAPELTVVVDREKARFSTWYEFFPRSTGGEPGKHGTLRESEERLPYIAAMGFDTLYLPPIHPIGFTSRKGRNNATEATPDDPGSPWAIGSEAGGHMAIHPQLGTLEDFRRFVGRARALGIEVGLDYAIQTSPDHPYVREHPEWFRWRPDGTIQYAENPPKRYQDVYPVNFETTHWRELWEELKGIVCFWIEQGVHVFRVDNPHTKPFPFWEWLITEVKQEHPDVIFLAEAFTRPKVMYRLAKLGFTQSYTYFTWRNTKQELTDYFTELAQTGVREFFRPNLWTNTQDILPEFLQHGGRAAYMIRLVLAATLGASYGIYGPAFELMESEPREPGVEEYRDSEKYEVKHWPLDRPDSLKDFIARVNRIRKENAALHSDHSLRFHPVDNDQIVAYSKRSDDGTNLIVTVVGLDPYHAHSGWLELPLEELGLDPMQSYQMHDLLTDARYLWQGPRNFVALDPHSAPAQIFSVRRRVRTEHDFDYFL